MRPTHPVGPFFLFVGGFIIGFSSGENTLCLAISGAGDTCLSDQSLEYYIIRIKKEKSGALNHTGSEPRLSQERKGVGRNEN